jgi:cytochrome c peroxidase
MGYPIIFLSIVGQRFVAVMAATLLAGVAAGSVQAQQTGQARHAEPLLTKNPSGMLQTNTPTGQINTDNAFFKSFGSNGRSCDSCHRQAQGWSVSPDELRQRFNKSSGSDPIFALVDGANSPLADVSSVYARRVAYSMLLNRGVVRIGMPMPANAEFRLTAVDDPYAYASARDMSLFRRPLPSTNLIWLTAVMWDGRETRMSFQPPMDAGIDHEDIIESLGSQARDAILGHEQAMAAPSASVIDEIVNFEVHLFTAQLIDQEAGKLNGGDGMGGANILAQQRFWVGINDTLGHDPTGDAFDEKSMRLFDEWNDPNAQSSHDPRERARASIARGEQLFNTLPIAISGVGGLNDALGQPLIQGTCTTCHNAPNIGNHSVALPINIGIADGSRRTPDMPLYTLTNYRTGQVVKTTDPGLAMRTGKWADIGKFKGPILRGVAARAPYFHNGFAATLKDVVDFYDTRFSIHMNGQQKHDLVAFLAAL